MSQENLELARRGTEALNRHDFEAMAVVMDPLIEWNDERELRRRDLPTAPRRCAPPAGDV